MELLCYCIGAALLVLTGAVISGGLTLPTPLWREAVSYTHLDVYKRQVLPVTFSSLSRYSMICS